MSKLFKKDAEEKECGQDTHSTSHSSQGLRLFEIILYIQWQWQFSRA